MTGPVEWASRVLLNNSEYRRLDWADLMPNEDYKGQYPFLKDVLMIAKQIWWLGPSTELFCSMHLRDELSEFVSRHAPGCNLNRELPDINVNSRRIVYDPAELCPLVRLLYPEDSIMWERWCAGTQLPVQTRRTVSDLGPLTTSVESRVLAEAKKTTRLEKRARIHRLIS